MVELYQEQIREIRSRLGGLEDIRESLGLSRKQISELLMVDPSAWSRWTKDGESAPPHVYRSLDWYCQLVADTPLKGAHDHLSQVERRLRRNYHDLIQRIQELESQKRTEVPTLKPSQTETGEALTFGWKMLLILNMGAVFYLLIQSFL